MLAKELVIRKLNQQLKNLKKIFLMSAFMIANKFWIHLNIEIEKNFKGLGKENENKKKLKFQKKS